MSLLGVSIYGLTLASWLKLMVVGFIVFAIVRWICSLARGPDYGTDISFGGFE